MYKYHCTGPCESLGQNYSALAVQVLYARQSFVKEYPACFRIFNNIPDFYLDGNNILHPQQWEPLKNRLAKVWYDAEMENCFAYLTFVLSPMFILINSDLGKGTLKWRCYETTKPPVGRPFLQGARTQQDEAWFLLKAWIAAPAFASQKQRMNFFFKE